MVQFGLLNAAIKRGFIHRLLWNMRVRLANVNDLPLLTHIDCHWLDQIVSFLLECLNNVAISFLVSMD